MARQRPSQPGWEDVLLPSNKPRPRTTQDDSSPFKPPQESEPTSEAGPRPTSSGQSRPRGRGHQDQALVVPRRALEDQLSRTRFQLVESEKRAAVAEAVAEERGRMLVETQRNLEHATLALRAIAGDPTVGHDPENTYLVQYGESAKGPRELTPAEPRALEQASALRKGFARLRRR